MDKIITQDCYLEATNGTIVLADQVVHTFSGKRLEKHTDMVVLTKQEFKNAIGDAFEEGLDNLSVFRNKTEYIQNIYTPETKK